MEEWLKMQEMPMSHKNKGMENAQKDTNKWNCKSGKDNDGQN